MKRPRTLPIPDLIEHAQDVNEQGKPGRPVKDLGQPRLHALPLTSGEDNRPNVSACGRHRRFLLLWRIT